MVNLNVKWLTESYELLISLEFSPVTVVPELFFKKKNGGMISLVDNIVNDQLLPGNKSVIVQFIRLFNEGFKIVTIKHGSDNVQFFGINITQNDDVSVEANVDGIRKAVEHSPSPV